jgi:hypothetical protein
MNGLSEVNLRIFSEFKADSMPINYPEVMLQYKSLILF